MRNNVINNLKLNNKNYPKYCFPFGFGLVHHTLYGFNLNGYKPGYRYNFKNNLKFYKNSTLLRIFDYGRSRINRLNGDNRFASLPYFNHIPICT